MPLVHGKSKKSFEKNVKTEIESGKPLNNLSPSHTMSNARLKRKPKKKTLLRTQALQPSANTLKRRWPKAVKSKVAG